jgi:hypothetical protein
MGPWFRLRRARDAPFVDCLLAFDSRRFLAALYGHFIAGTKSKATKKTPPFVSPVREFRRYFFFFAQKKKIR